MWAKQLKYTQTPCSTHIPTIHEFLHVGEAHTHHVKGFVRICPGLGLHYLRIQFNITLCSGANFNVVRK